MEVLRGPSGRPVPFAFGAEELEHPLRRCGKVERPGAGHVHELHRRLSHPALLRRHQPSHDLMQRWTTSTGSQYMRGQPPTMLCIPRAWHSRTASSEMLPWPNERWNQTRLMPRSPHCRTTSIATSGWVAMTTPSTGPGIEPTSGKHRTPSTSGALGLTGIVSYPASRSFRNMKLAALPRVRETPATAIRFPWRNSATDSGTLAIDYSFPLHAPTSAPYFLGSSPPAQAMNSQWP